MANQADLARALGCKQQTVSRWEAGTHRPQRDQLRQLAEVLEVAEGELEALAGYHGPTAARPLQLFPVDALDERTFERFTADLVQELYPEAKVRLAGATGHAQEGIDVSIVWPDGTTWTLQCKRVSQFGPAQVAAVVEKQTVQADKKILVLSRVASPQTAAALRAFEGWELWDKEDLARLIRLKLPPAAQDRLVDIYFSGQRMTLLGRSEIGPWLTVEEFFRPYEGATKALSHDWPLIGREDELTELLASINDGTRITVVSGPGGIGKSRLVKEGLLQFSAAHRAPLIRLLSTTRDATQENIAALGSRPKILVVDDAHDRDSLGLLLSHAADPASQTQLLIGARTYAVDRIEQDALTFGGDKPRCIALSPLPGPANNELAKEALISAGAPASWAGDIAGHIRDNPLVLLMAARIIARDQGSLEMARDERDMRNLVLGTFTRDIARLAGPQEEKLHRAVLELLALLQPFHIEDTGLVDFISRATALSKNDVSRALRNLLDGGVIFKRGHQYRLMPDVLGDYLIEMSCIGPDDRLSPLVDRVLDFATDKYLTNIVVNLGRLDWRRSGGDPAGSHLLREVWRRFETIEDKYDHRFDAVKAVAVFQPQQALEFVQGQLEKGRFSRELASILRNIAFNYDYVEDACQLLWAMGRDDNRERNSHTEHPLRILSELCAYGDRKPLAYCERVFEFGLKLFDDADAWTHRHSPLDVVEPILSGNVSVTRSKGASIEFSSFFVDYDLVAHLRAKLIRRVEDLLSDPDPSLSYRAATFLQKALHSPMGMMGAAPEPALREKYHREFTGTLKRAAQKMRAGGLRGTTIIGIAHSVAWHAEFSTGALGKAARDLLKALPDDLAFRTRSALADGFGRLMHRRNFGEGAQEDWQKWLNDLATEIKAVHQEPEDLRSYLNSAITDLDAAGMSSDSAYALVNALLAADLDFSRTLLEDALARPNSATRRFSASALHQLLVLARSEARRFAQGMLDSGDGNLSLAVMNAFFGYRDVIAPEEIALIRQGLASALPGVAVTGLRVLWSQKTIPDEIVAGLLEEVRYEQNPALFDDVATLYSIKERRLLDRMTESDVRRLLVRMRALPELDGHWTSELLMALSFRFPMELAQFIFERVERAARKDAGIGSVLPFGIRHERQQLRFLESPKASAVLLAAWQWLQTNADRDGHFAYLATEAFEAMFPAVNDEVVHFFDAQLDLAGTMELGQMSRILSKAHHDFVFTHSGFVERFLERCRQAGGDILIDARRDLYCGASSGMRSGEYGKPMPRDVETVVRASVILERLSRVSPAFKLYSDIRASAQADIDEALKNAKALEEE